MYHSVSHWEKGQKCKANFVLAHSAFPEFYIQSCDSGILLPWDAIKDVACGISEQIITDHSSIGHKIKAITCKICNKAPRTIYKHVTIRFCASTDESLNSQRVLYVRVGISNATSSHGANRRKFSHCGINISWQEHRHKLSSSQSVSPLFFFFWGGILVYCPLELRPIVLSRDGGSAVEQIINWWSLSSTLGNNLLAPTCWDIMYLACVDVTWHLSYPLLTYNPEWTTRNSAHHWTKT